jgi:hypothetical protein
MAHIYYFPDPNGEEKLTPEDWSIWNFFLPFPSKRPQTGDSGLMVSYQNGRAIWTRLSGQDDATQLPFAFTKLPDEALRYFLSQVFEAE